MGFVMFSCAAVIQIPCLIHMHLERSITCVQAHKIIAGVDKIIPSACDSTKNLRHVAQVGIYGISKLQWIRCCRCSWFQNLIIWHQSHCGMSSDSHRMADRHVFFGKWFPICLWLLRFDFDLSTFCSKHVTVSLPWAMSICSEFISCPWFTSKFHQHQSGMSADIRSFKSVTRSDWVHVFLRKMVHRFQFATS